MMQDDWNYPVEEKTDRKLPEDYQLNWLNNMCDNHPVMLVVLTAVICAIPVSLIYYFG